MGESSKDLIVWQRAVQLSLAVYKLTSTFPEAERFGLTSQMRRASVSVASNIAEGYGKSSEASICCFSVTHAVPTANFRHSWSSLKVWDLVLNHCVVPQANSAAK